MRKRKTYIVVAVLLVAIVGMMGLANGCGSSDTTDGASASPTGGAAISGSAMERATATLGHAPTGLALDIVTKGEVVVANDSNYAPQSSVDPVTKEVVGFDVDVAKGMAEILGLTIKWEHPAWETIPGGLNNGRYDVSIGSMTITPDRQKTLDFTGPYYFTPAVVITRVGTPGLDTVETLAGKTIGTAAGSTYYDWLQANTKAKIKSYDSSVTSMTDLAKKRLDGVMTAAPTAQQAIAAGQPFQITGKPFFYEDLGMAMKKGEPDWLALLDYAVKTMHEDGSLTAMSTQWYNGLDLTVQQ